MSTLFIADEALETSSSNRKPTMTIRTIALAALTVAGVSMSSPAHAFPKVPKKPKAPAAVKGALNHGAEQDKKAMNEVNELASEGSSLVPSSLRDTMTDIRTIEARLEEARPIYEKCAAKVKSVSDPEKVYEGAYHRWLSFKGRYERSVLQLPIARIAQPAGILQAQGVPTVEADLDAMEEAIKAFETAAGKDAASDIAAWKERLTKLRDTHVDLLRYDAPRPAADGFKLSNSERTKVVKRGHEAISAMSDATRGAKGALPAKLWSDLEAVLEDGDVFTPNIRKAFTHKALGYRIFDAWWAKDHAAAVAKAFGDAAVVDSGVLSSANGKVGFAAKAGHCYLLTGRSAPGTGHAKPNSMSPVWGKDFASVNAMRGGDWTTRFVGACPSSDMTLSWEIALETDDAAVSWRWVAMSWPRASFPVELAAMAGVVLPKCSAPAFESAFTYGVPGLVNWFGSGRPVVIDHPSINSSLFWYSNATQGNKGIMELEAAWPEEMNLPKPAYRQDCAREESSPDPLVSAMIQCHASVSKEYEAKLEGLRKRRDATNKLNEKKSLHNAIEKTAEAAKKARKQKCGGAEAKVEKAMSVAIGNINDYFKKGQRPEGSPDVPRYMRQIWVGGHVFN